MTTTTVCQWFKGITPEEGARRGVQRIALPKFAVGDRVTMRHNTAPATVVRLDPMLHTHRDSDWIYQVTEDGGLEYPTLDTNMRPAR